MKVFSSQAGKEKKATRSKVFTVVMLCSMTFFIFFSSAKPASAQAATFDFTNFVQSVKQFIQEKVWVAIKKAGSIAFQRTLSTTLNKIAYDAANYIGSGGEGQSELFVKEDLMTYLEKIGDEAGGQFLETFANNLNAQESGTCEEKLDTCWKACYRMNSKGNKDPETDEQLKSFISGDYMNSQNTAICGDQCKKGATSCESSGNMAKDSGLDASSFNVCQPSSIEVKLKISLGLVDQTRPQGPNCTATEIINNWGDDIEAKLKAIQNEDYLTNLSSIFDPRANDLGIYFLASTDLAGGMEYEKEIKKSEVTESGGWIDVRNIAGELKGTPDAAQKAEEDARALRVQSFGKTTGDILVDASNVFLNQLAISAYNNLMRKLSEKKDSVSVTDNAADPTVTFGESSMREKTRILIEPKYDVKSDYDVLAKLAVCTDPNNPGPDSCVIDDGFLQAITEKKTVAEALKGGLLHSNWAIKKDVVAGAYNSHYSLRNIKILRKYRVLPVGWEVAIENAFASSTKIKEATLGDLISCYNQNDEYSDFSTNFNTKDVAWCQGMVDPNWVLKAPLNYCKKEGAGGYISSTFMIPGIKGISGSADTLSTIAISRSDDYCADNQSCIKENKEGSCDLFGYCNEEKRTWRFDSDTCSPISNTCQTYTNTANGKSAAYLKNTIDFSGCNVDNAGCRQYSITGAYASSTVAWDPAKTIYLNKNLQSCTPTNEGCSQFIRVKPTWGANLLVDGNFTAEEFGDSSESGVLGSWLVAGGDVYVVDMNAEISSEPSVKAVKIDGSGVISLESTPKSFPDNLQVIAGQNYTLSADVFVTEGSAELALNTSGEKISSSTSVNGSWQKLSVTASSIDGMNNLNFSVSGIALYVKNIKLELGDWSTSFSSYGSYKVNQKVLPSYLEKTCYADSVSAAKDYRLKSGAPSVCSSYSRKCNADEAGCQLYTGLRDKFSIPAKVASTDYCPSECNDYDVYIAKETTFHSTEAENIIPSASESCEQEAVGCSEFTNLDEVAQGGEGKEYYVSLRQCIKPNTAKCANFYSWEDGNQVKWYSLEKDSSNNPLINFGDEEEADCSAIYNLPISDPRYNPDCRKFTNTSGQVSYRLISRTITCSENCHSYRLSGNNIDRSIRDAADCSGVSMHWNASNNSCTVCRNGGVWSDGQSACLYQAIPDEGKTCSAEDNGCREYNGNYGNSVRLADYFDFNGGLGDWTSNCENGVASSPISSTDGGKSMFYSNSANSCTPLSVGRSSVIEKVFAGDNHVAKSILNFSPISGRAYTMKFMARAAGNGANLKVYFRDENTGEKSYFSITGQEGTPIAVKGGLEWAVYNVNLPSLGFSPAGRVSVNIISDNDIWVDNVIINEISNRYYLKKGTSDIPDICYYDNLGKYQGADYNLGCSQYQDKDNLKHSLRNFSRLCQSSSVGCELMIDTKNYSPSEAGVWNDDNNNGACDSGENDCVSVSRDNALYLVYDKKNSCLPSDIGCSRLGEGLGSGADVSWSDSFKLNNPDNYYRTLCGSYDVGCEEYKESDTGSVTYFRNPANNVCVYRNSQSAAVNGKAWYKASVKRCDKNSDGEIRGTEMAGSICVRDLDCGNLPCIVDGNDYNCSVSYTKTIGYGGAGGIVPVPDKSVGLCDTAFSSCTEYIDPTSRFNPNLVYNPNMYNQSGWGDDTWLGSAIGANEQVIDLERNKLYTFSANKDSDGSYSYGAVLSFVRNVKTLGSDNKISTTSVQNLYLTSGVQPIIFHSLDNYSAKLSGGASGVTINIRELSVNYNMAGSVDTKSCSGVANFDNGCVLFNERAINGASGYAPNSYNADLTKDGKAPVANFAPYSANKLIKVRPDRVCAKWLACTSYAVNEETGDGECYSMGECSLLDDKNECANIINYPVGQSNTFDPKKDRNASGYAIANQYYFNNITEAGLNSEAHYDLEETIPPLSCVKKGVNGNPVLSGDNKCVFEKNIIKDNLVREPAGSPVDYLASGKAYLKAFDSQFISPQGNGSYVLLSEIGDYYINFLVNTKGAESPARVSIYKINAMNSDGTITSYTDLATESITSRNGWERKILKFSTTVENSKVRIYLGTTGATGGGSVVYFDDINIEPVLLTGKNKTVARDCRLYPTSESLSCSDKDNTVVRNGIEGYCLEYDLANPEVCQTWYPVDKISSSRLISSKLGYTGKYPLSYCAEVNTNFVLLEKRKAAIVKQEQKRRNDNDYLGVRKCYYPPLPGISNPASLYDYCRRFFSGDLSNQVEFSSSTPRSASTTSGIVITTNGSTTTWTTTSGAELVEPADEITLSGAAIEDIYNADVSGYCGNSGNYLLLFTQDLKQENTEWFKRDDVAGTWICIPINSPYNPLQYRYVQDLGEPITTYDGFQKFTPFSDGWYFADGFDYSVGVVSGNDNAPQGFNEAFNDDPPIMVIDLNNSSVPASKNELKKIYSKDEDEIFGLTCNKFYEAVSGSGDNKAHSYFVGKDSPYPTSTPNMFNVGIKFNNYGRKLGDIPYGAASWPDDFNLIGSNRVPLLNQYSMKNSNDVFAGRPYGCDSSLNIDGSVNVALSNCSMIGYCSANPDVYCLVDQGYNPYAVNPTAEDYRFGNDTAFNLAKQSCGSYGTCQPLWTTIGARNISSFASLKSSAEPVIKGHMFLQAPVAYEFKSDGYQSVSGFYAGDIDSSRPSIADTIRLSNASGLINPGTLLKVGSYTLKFNTLVDKNHQPLKQIVVDWGDNYKQVITDQDQRPEYSNPHTLYHYYGTAGHRTINIKAYDNWGLFSTRSVVF